MNWKIFWISLITMLVGLPLLGLGLTFLVELALKHQGVAIWGFDIVLIVCVALMFGWMAEQ